MINYAVTNTCGTTTVSTLVTVNTVPAVEPITGTTTLCAGSTTQLADVTAGGIWTSTDETVATGRLPMSCDCLVCWYNDDQLCSD
ncbi:MAG: hypothetical protein WDO16_13485 [Bacteroidota bacterium]